MFRKIARKHEAKIQSLLAEIERLENNINSLKDTQNSINSSITQLNAQRAKAEQEATKATKELDLIKNKISAYGTLEDVAYDYIPSNEIQSALEEKLSALEARMGGMLAMNSAYTFGRDYLIDGSVMKGHKFQESFAKNLALGFNDYVQKKWKSITVDNYQKTIDLIDKSFKKFNRQGDMVKVYLSQDYLEIIKKITKLKLDIKLAKQEEKDALRKEKERIREQEKLLEELAKEKEKLAKERRYYEAIYGETNSDEKRLEIQQQLTEIDKREKDIDYREKNQKAGWLYVAYTPAMPKCVKLGISRRLNPSVRLQELSSASVPFPFECKGLVFSDDVFELEANIHNHFDAQRVNKGNRHKEFFYVTPEEAIKVLKEKFGCKIIFVEGA